LRLVSEQMDCKVRGGWRGDTFVLDTDLTLDALVEFLVDEYRPSPIITPWNKGSGFGPDDAVKSPAAFEAVSAIRSSDLPRLAAYREAVGAALQLSEDPSWALLDKADQVSLCRSALPDECIEWIDAAVIITTDSRVFPPLLGTGGNDGRLDFGSNFMQRLATVLRIGAKPAAKEVVMTLARDSVSGSSLGRLESAAIGQFDPAAAGGQRSAPAGAAASLLNPWDFVLLFEGAASFASSVARRFGSSSSRSAMPFTVAGLSAAYSSAADENGRGEFWAPLWRRPASAAEVLRLIGEGRAEYHGRQARTAVDAARALGSLGVDRGIDEFVRFGFLERNGLSTFCVPVGRMKVGAQAAVNVLGDLDTWVSSVRSVPSKPSSAVALLRSIDSRNIAISQAGAAEQLQELLYDASQLDRLVRKSRALSEKARPLTGLNADTWLPLLDDESPEFNVAVALASFREPRSTSGWIRRLLGRDAWPPRRPDVDGFEQRSLLSVLAECLVQVAARTKQPAGEVDGCWCGPATAVWCPEPDFVAFVIGMCDVDRVEHLLSSLMLLDWSYCSWKPVPSEARSELHRVSAEVALLKPLFHHRALGPLIDTGRPLQPDRSIPRLLASGRVASAVQAGLRNVRVAACKPLVGAESLAARIDGAQVAASLLIPISDATALRLLNRVADFGGTTRKETSE
jgi:CRISPR-associated protein Csx17